MHFERALELALDEGDARQVCGRRLPMVDRPYVSGSRRGRPHPYCVLLAARIPMNLKR